MLSFNEDRIGICLEGATAMEFAFASRKEMDAAFLEWLRLTDLVSTGLSGELTMQERLSLAGI